MTIEYDIDAIRERLRQRSSENASTSGYQATAKAAVAALIRGASTGPEILLIKRAERAGDPWSGHMGFPGGREDARDANALETAIRETREEIGIDLRERGELLGQLPDLPAIGRTRDMGMVVTPFVFVVEHVSFTANEEVAEIVWSPLGPMLRGETDTTLDYPYNGQTFTMPGYKVGPHVVWGMTYRMLQTLFEALREQP